VSKISSNLEKYSEVSGCDGRFYVYSPAECGAGRNAWSMPDRSGSERESSNVPGCIFDEGAFRLSAQSRNVS